MHQVLGADMSPSGVLRAIEGVGASPTQGGPKSPARPEAWVSAAGPQRACVTLGRSVLNRSALQCRRAD